MASENRSSKSDLANEVRERLESEPWRFDFFQAVRRLEHLHPDRPRVGEARSFEEEFVHFGQKPTLAFQPSTIASFETSSDEDQSEAESSPDRMLVYFLGLFGPNGPMPLDFTEFVIDWANGRSERLERLNRKTGSRLSVGGGLSTDSSRDLERERLARFFDVFHHRLISFFYRAWAHHEPAVSFDRADDPFATYVGSLGGFANDAVFGLDAVPHSAKLHQLGHLSNPRAYPEGLESIIEDYFGVAAEVEEFVGQWVEIPEECRPRLGVANHRLDGAELPSLWDDEESTGSSPTLGDSGFEISEVVLGERVWDCQQKFRLRLGPMPLERFELLLPGGAQHAELVAWVRNYVGDALAWDVQLVLDRIPSLDLGGRSQLGLTTWLPGEDESRSRTNLDDLVVEPIRARTRTAHVA